EEVRALMLEAMASSNPDPKTSAALRQLESSSAAAANAIASIDAARQTVLDNLANADTTAFKAMRATLREEGKIQYQRDFSPGPLKNPNQPLNLAISGEGFFQVQADKGVAYTRNGKFVVNDKGEMIVDLADGYRMVPPISSPANVTEVAVSE